MNVPRTSNADIARAQGRSARESIADKARSDNRERHVSSQRSILAAAYRQANATR